MTEYQEICSIWKSLDIQNKSQLEDRLDSFKILFAYHSSKIENEEKKEYLKTLRAFDEAESLDPLLDFLKEATVTTWRRLLKEEQTAKRSIRPFAAYL